jgi:hypothetical protein
MRTLKSMNANQFYCLKSLDSGVSAAQECIHILASCPEARKVLGVPKHPEMLVLCILNKEKKLAFTCYEKKLFFLM